MSDPAGPAGVALLRHAVFRVAAWPIEIVDGLRAPELAELASRRRDALATAAASDGILADVVHDAVGAAADSGVRRALLAVRRALHDPARRIPDLAFNGAPAAPELVDLVDRIDRAREVRRENQRGREELERVHTSVLMAHRGSLREIASTDRFRCALVVAEPAVAQRWESVRSRALSDKARVRRLEATLLHFAMRSCGRPTPNGGWAGVTLVEPSEGDGGAGLSVVPADRRVHVAVDLAPFVAFLGLRGPAMARDPDHPLRLEPTLVGRLADRGHSWVYLRRDTEPFEFVALQAEDMVAAVAAFWADGGRRPARGLLDRVSEAEGPRALEQATAVVGHLVRCGVLHSAAVLPAFANDAWEALDAVHEQLTGPDREAWGTTVQHAKAGAEALASAFLRDDPAGVAAAARSIESAVDALLAVAGGPPVRPGSVVRLDLRVPFDVSWNSTARAAVAAAVDELHAFHAGEGAAEAYRRVMADRVADVVASCSQGALTLVEAVALDADRWTAPTERPSLRADVLRSVGIDPSPAERHWTAVLAVAHHEVEHRLGGSACSSSGQVPSRDAPAGSVLVAFGDGHIWARGGRPQPGMFVSRVAAVLGDRVVAALDELGGSFATIPAVRVVGSDAVNPNAALRRAASPGTSPIGWHLAGEPGWGEGWQVVLGQEGQDGRGASRPSIMLADGSLRVAVYDSAAVIGSRDPLTRFLRTIAMAQGWELVSWGFPILPDELDSWHRLPRLVLPAGAVLSARRWIVTSDVLAAVRAAAGRSEADGYLSWRAAMDDLDVPPVVLARWELVPDAPELVLSTESPLALRALLDRTAPDAGPMVLTELPGEPGTWPVGSDGGHHLAELAVTWTLDGEAT